MRDLTKELDEIDAGSRVTTESGVPGSSTTGIGGALGGNADVENWMRITYTLLLLKDLGLDPASEEARRSISLGVTPSHDGSSMASPTSMARQSPLEQGVTPESCILGFRIVEPRLHQTQGTR